MMTPAGRAAARATGFRPNSSPNTTRDQGSDTEYAAEGELAPSSEVSVQVHVFVRAPSLAGFEGTVLAVSHDRAFLRTLDWFLYLQHNGKIFEITDPTEAIRAVAERAEPRPSGSIRLLTLSRSR